MLWITRRCPRGFPTGAPSKSICPPFGRSLRTDRRLKLEFHGSKITSDAGLLAYRELDHALGLTGMGGLILTEARRGKNIRHLVEALFRQSVFGRLAGYEDVNDAERLSLDPAMRTIVGRRGLDRNAASTSEMGRFETEWLASEGNFAYSYPWRCQLGTIAMDLKVIWEMSAKNC